MRPFLITDMEKQLKELKEKFGDVEVRIAGAYKPQEWPCFVYNVSTEMSNTTLIPGDEYIAIEGTRKH